MALSGSKAMAFSGVVSTCTVCDGTGTGNNARKRQEMKTKVRDTDGVAATMSIPPTSNLMRSMRLCKKGSR